MTHQPNHVQNPNINQNPQIVKGHMPYRPNIPQNYDIDMFVKSYLEKRGYRKLSESEYTKDSSTALENIACKLLLQGEINMSNYITFWNGHEKFPYHTIKSYKELRSWVHKNVEANKVKFLCFKNNMIVINLIFFLARTIAYYVSYIYTYIY